MSTPMSQRQATVKPHDLKATLIRLWGYMKRSRWLVLTAVLLNLSSNLLVLAGPLLSGCAVNAMGTVPGQVDFQKVGFYCTLMLIFYFCSSGIAYLQNWLMIRLSQRIIHQMRKDVFEHLLSLPVGFFDRHQTGDIISHLSYDIDTVNSSLSSDLVQIMTSIVTVVGSLVMMLAISPPMMVIFLVTIPSAILVTRYRTRILQPLFRRRSAALGSLNGFVEESVSGMRAIHAYGCENVFQGRFDERNEEAVTAYYNAECIASTVGPSVNFVNHISMALIGVFGSVLYIKQRISIGALSSFVLYSRKFSGPINEAANIIGDLESACAAAERVFNLLDEKPEPADLPGAEEIREPRGDVVLEQVNFGYQPEKPVLQGVNLHAKPGSMVAIVGPTGAGKTTIINLLMRFYDPQSGSIRLDGRETSLITRRSLRKSFSMVLQDTWLFSGTVYENIAYGSETATREDVIRAAKAAHIHHYIMGLPKGYDTPLNENGVNISQGQKQLMTIARAMLLDCSMLILDEATSNVDTRTEQQIQEAMRRLMQDKTCFVIAHRLSTIQNADTILVIQGGRIAEQGTHTELLAKGGVYAALYRSQFQ